MRDDIYTYVYLNAHAKDYSHLCASCGLAQEPAIETKGQLCYECAWDAAWFASRCRGYVWGQ